MKTRSLSGMQILSLKSLLPSIINSRKGAYWSYTLCRPCFGRRGLGVRFKTATLRGVHHFRIWKLYRKSTQENFESFSFFFFNIVTHHDLKVPWTFSFGLILFYFNHFFKQIQLFNKLWHYISIYNVYQWLSIYNVGFFSFFSRNIIMDLAIMGMGR